MVTPLTRTLSITYGTFEVGGSTARRIDGGYSLTETGDRVQCEYSFFVIASSAADFKSQVAAVEAAFASQRETLTIKLDSQTIHTFAPTDGTGQDAFVTLEKGIDEGDTARSRRYTVRVDMGRDTTGSSNGAREVTVTTTFDLSRRRQIEIAGEWVGGSGGTASARYSAGIEARVTSIMTSLNVTVYELCDEQIETNTQNTICRFKRIYDEILFGQPTGGPVDHPAIVRQTFVITRHESAQAEGGGVSAGTLIGSGNRGGSTQAVKPKGNGRATTVKCDYQCNVRFDKSTDLKGLWDGTIKGAILTRARAIFASDVVAILDESVSFDQDYNTIKATILAQVASKGDVLSARLETEDTVKKGHILIPVLTADRNPYAKYIFRGPGQITRRVMETVSVIDGTFTPPFTDGIPQEVALPSGDSAGSVSVAAVLDVRESRSKRSIGIAGSEIPVLDYTCETTLEMYEPYGGGGPAATSKLL
jgi:hypothetical protein